MPLGIECVSFRFMMQRVTDDPSAAPHRNLHPDALRELVRHPAGCPSCLAWAELLAAETAGADGPSPALAAALDELSALEAYWNWKDGASPDQDDLCAVWRTTIRYFGRFGAAERATEMRKVLGPHVMDCDACESFKPESDAHLEANADALLDFFTELLVGGIEDLGGEDDDAFDGDD